MKLVKSFIIVFFIFSLIPAVAFAGDYTPSTLVEEQAKEVVNGEACLKPEIPCVNRPRTFGPVAAKIGEMLDQEWKKQQQQLIDKAKTVQKQEKLDLSKIEQQITTVESTIGKVLRSDLESGDKYRYINRLKGFKERLENQKETVKLFFKETRSLKQKITKLEQEVEQVKSELDQKKKKLEQKRTHKEPKQTVKTASKSEEKEESSSFFLYVLIGLTALILGTMWIRERSLRSQVMQENEKLKDEKTELEEQVKDEKSAQNEVEELESRINELKQERGQLQEDLSNKEGRVERLQNEIENLRNSLSEEEKKREKTKSKNQKLEKVASNYQKLKGEVLGIAGIDELGPALDFLQEQQKDKEALRDTGEFEAVEKRNPSDTNQGIPTIDEESYNDTDQEAETRKIHHEEMPTNLGVRTGTFDQIADKFAEDCDGRQKKSTEGGWGADEGRIPDSQEQLGAATTATDDKKSAASRDSNREVSGIFEKAEFEEPADTNPNLGAPPPEEDERKED